MCSQISDEQIRVNKISGSLRKKHSARKFNCELDRDLANTFITEDYEQSNHTRVCIGEWHTHPEANPTPSFTDLSSIKAAFRKNYRPIKNYILMVIVGRKSIYWGMYNGKIFTVVTPKIV